MASAQVLTGVASSLRSSKRTHQGRIRDTECRDRKAMPTAEERSREGKDADEETNTDARNKGVSSEESCYKEKGCWWRKNMQPHKLTASESHRQWECCK